MLSPLSRGLPPPRSQWELLEVGGRGAERSLCSSCPHRTHPPSHPRSRSRGGGIKPQSGGGWATEDPDCTPPNGAPREGVYDPLRPPTKGSNTPLRRLCGCGGAQKRAAIAQLPPHHGGVRAFRAPHRTAPRGSTAGGSEPKGAELLRGGGMGPPWAEPHQSRGGGGGPGSPSFRAAPQPPLRTFQWRFSPRSAGAHRPLRRGAARRKQSPPTAPGGLRTLRANNAHRWAPGRAMLSEELTQHPRGALRPPHGQCRPRWLLCFCFCFCGRVAQTALHGSPRCALCSAPLFPSPTQSTEHFIWPRSTARPRLTAHVWTAP